MVLEKMGVSVAQLPQELAGSNYLGNRHSPANTRRNPEIPYWENCALFLTKIPVETTLHDLFGVIKTGAVYCLHINPPTGMHRTKAAKLAFMSPEAAAAFLAEIRGPKGVVLHGQHIQGQYNRNAYARNEKAQSRVLKLIGPTPIMTFEFWTSHFAKFSEFELEDYRLTTEYPFSGMTEIVFRFARIDGQAQTCLQCIRTDPSLAGVVQVMYGNDPCGLSMTGSVS
jgi:hypothetical protein